MRVLWARARRRATFVACFAVLATPSCRTGRAQTETPGPKYLGDFRGAPTEVDPAFAEPWAALQAAVAADPGGAEAVAAADRLLSAGPPFELRMWGVHAKANAAYLAGDDEAATRMVDQVLAAAPADAPADAVSAMNLLLCRALVRSGDPARGLVVLEGPALLREGVVAPDEALALRAVGLDRAGRPDALSAFVRWRAAITVDDAAAAFALRRATALSSSMGARATAAAASKETGTVAACLRGLSGAAIGELDPPWLGACQAAPPKIGILLPRTGPMAALADTHLAAALAAIEVLGPTHPGADDVLWQDSGADAASAADGAAALVAAGANVIVGPIGPAAIRAAKGRVGASARLVIPGEPVGDVAGAAPTLERRVAALVGVAVDRGATDVIVLAPESTYGKRAQAAVAAELAVRKRAKARMVTYPPESTSFAPITDPFVKSIDSHTAVVIADHVARTELIVRQLARDGKGPGGKSGALVLATAEGISDAQAGAGHDVFAQMIVAPTAATTAAAESFARAFVAAEGVAPPDQALLVHRALAMAFDGAPPDPSPVVVARVEGGRLVVESAP